LLTPRLDIDPESLDYARRNVSINGLEDRIRIVAKTKDDPYLLPLKDCSIDKADFTMTNPPFYESEADLAQSAKKKARPPNSACTGAPVEMVVEGGEVAFVGRLLEESLLFRDRVQWYTSMFGKLPSLQEFIGKLRQNGIDNYAVTEFVQGKRTKRWAVGWSFSDMRPSDKAARGLKAATWRSLLPPTTWVEICKFPTDRGVSPVTQRITGMMASLELISWMWETEKLQGVGRARDNVWGRAWRRKNKRQEHLQDDYTAPARRPEDTEEVCKLGFLVSIRISRSEATVGLRWLEGHDSGLFYSLSGYVKSQLTSLVLSVANQPTTYNNEPHILS
jgi:23S rRNA (adenine1618-N6)-methyltransferase